MGSHRWCKIPATLQLHDVLDFWPRSHDPKQLRIPTYLKGHTSRNPQNTVYIPVVCRKNLRIKMNPAPVDSFGVLIFRISIAGENKFDKVQQNTGQLLRYAPISGMVMVPTPSVEKLFFAQQLVHRSCTKSPPAPGCLFGMSWAHRLTDETQQWSEASWGTRLYPIHQLGLLRVHVRPLVSAISGQTISAKCPKPPVLFSKIFLGMTWSRKTLRQRFKELSMIVPTVSATVMVTKSKCCDLRFQRHKPSQGTVPLCLPPSKSAENSSILVACDLINSLQIPNVTLTILLRQFGMVRHLGSFGRLFSHGDFCLCRYKYLCMCIFVYMVSAPTKTYL